MSIVIIVGVLGTLLPAAHSQPWLPFAVRYEAAIFSHPTLIYRTKAIFAVTVSVTGIVFLIAAVFLRIARWPLLVAGALGISFIPPSGLHRY